MIGLGVFYCNSFFLITNDSFFDTLINMGAVMIINEFDDIFGRILIIRLQTFEHEILWHEEFM